MADSKPMTTTQVSQALVERQMKLEQEALDDGVAAYRKRNLGFQQRGSMAGTDAGKRIVAGKVEQLAEEIKKWIAERKVKPGARATAVKYMEMLEPELVSFLTIRTALDSLALRAKLNTAAVHIADALEDECRFRAFEAGSEKLYEKINTNFDASPWNFSPDRRRMVLVHAANKFDIKWSGWERSEKIHLGMALLTLLIESVGLVDKQMMANGNRNTPYYLVAKPDLIEWINEFNADRELMSPRFMPMIVPPIPWENTHGGGYYDPRLFKRLTLVKKASKSYLKELDFKPMPEVYAAVNALQETAWKINGPMLTVVNEIWDAGLEVKGLPSRFDKPLPAKPADFETNKNARATWKGEAGEVYRSNVRAGSKRLQTAKIKFLAEKFAPEAAIYFPVQLDFRGRMYSVPLFLNPQGCDLAKGLLTFAEGKPLGKTGVFWLGVHLANTYGEDKCSLQERYEWAVKNSAKIEASANDPLECRWWMDADKPFQFLAACIEWIGYLHDGGENYVCSLPIMVDGSCNGLQHFSAMLRDEVCGAKVNLVPSDKPADIYQTVADEVTVALHNEKGEYTFKGYAGPKTEKGKAKAAARHQAILSIIANTPSISLREIGTALERDYKMKVELSTIRTDVHALKIPSYIEEHSKEHLDFARKWIVYGITRKLCKRPVMVLPYGGTREAVQTYIMEHVLERATEKNEQHPFGNKLIPAVNYLAGIVWDAMKKVVKGPRVTMDWLQSTARLMTAHNQRIYWTTPSGFWVKQAYPSFKDRRIKTKLGHQVIFFTHKEEVRDKLDNRKQTQAISPNFVHSLDASALVATIVRAQSRGVNAMAAIHDSYGTLAADMQVLMDTLRECFVEMYETHDVLAEFAAAVNASLTVEGKQAPPVPARGDLDLRGILRSDFFFA